MQTGLNGFIIANKPTGVTSSDMVIFLRKRLPRGTSVGHGGTLDPEASGVLPICVGNATRLFDYIIDKEKTYVALMRLGVVTDTQDATGTVLEERPVNVKRTEIEQVLPSFTGQILQVPPMYSAIKRGGQPLYRLAREGKVIEIEPRPCRVDSIELLDEVEPDLYRLKVCCGKGVYIRTLCHDIGAALGCGAHMAALERTRAGVFTLEDALTREEIDEASRNGKLAESLIAPDAPLKHLPAVVLKPEARHAVINGNVLKPQWMMNPAPDAENTRIYLQDRFAGIGTPLPDGSIRFRAMLYTEET